MEQNAKPVVSIAMSGHTSSDLGKDRSVIFTSVILVIMIIVTVIFSIYRNDHNASHSCSSALLSQAVSYFGPNDQNQLAKVVSKIKTLNNYQKDPNCMYVLTVYYYNQGMPQQAGNSLSQFNKYYSGQKLNQALLKYASVGSLKELVANLEANAIQVERNMINLTPKPLNPKSLKK